VLIVCQRLIRVNIDIIHIGVLRVIRRMQIFSRWSAIDRESQIHGCCCILDVVGDDAEEVNGSAWALPDNPTVRTITDEARNGHTSEGERDVSEIASADRCIVPRLPIGASWVGVDKATRAVRPIRPLVWRGVVRQAPRGSIARLVVDGPVLDLREGRAGSRQQKQSRKR
jgi:hypothetical protein